MTITTFFLCWTFWGLLAVYLFAAITPGRPTIKVSALCVLVGGPIAWVYCLWLAWKAFRRGASDK